MPASTNAQAGGAFVPSRDVNFSGVVDFGSSAPTFQQTALNVTATGATGATATDLGLAVPAFVTVTGASGAGVNLNTGACIPGSSFVIKNMMTGVLKIYSVGATTINGVSGATGASLTATGNLTAQIFCTVAGAWQMVYNT